MNIYEITTLILATRETKKYLLSAENVHKAVALLFDSDNVKFNVLNPIETPIRSEWIGEQEELFKEYIIGDFDDGFKLEDAEWEEVELK